MEGLAWNNSGTSLSIETALARSGDACLKFLGTTAVYVTLPGVRASGVTQYARFWMRFPSLPAAQVNPARWIDGSSTIANIVMSTAGALSITSGTGASANLAVDTWYCIETSCVADGVNVTVTLRVDGVEVSTRTFASALIPSELRVGNISVIGTSWTAYFDDLALNDSTGSTNNSWPGLSGKIVLLRPVADLAIGASWTKGQTGAISGDGYTSIDQMPPTGIADNAAGADATQLRNAVLAITQPAADVDFTMEAATARGAAAGDTITAARVVSIAADNSSTLGRLVGQQLLSPSDGGETTYNTPGAAAAAYPTGWGHGAGTIVQAPGINGASQPTARFGRRGTTSIIMLAFLGVSVEYVTAAGTVQLTGSAALALAASASLGATGNLVSTAALAVDATAEAPSLTAALGGSAPIVMDASGSLSGVLVLLTGAGAIAFTAEGGLSLAATAALSGAGAIALTGAGELTLPALLQVTGAGSIALAGSAGLTLVAGPSTAQLAATAPIVLTGYAGLTKTLPPRDLGDFTARWQSGQHIGAARPGMRVMVRVGRLMRRHSAWTGPDFDAVISGVDAAINEFPWFPTWEAFTPYVPVPNVRDCRLEKSLETRGITTATLTIDNIIYAAEAAGHHSIKRGYLAPLRGYVGAGRTQLVDEQGQPVGQNEWFELLTRQAQITVWQSYGDAEVCVFTGLIDDVDSTSRPDVLTVTARCFGQVLADSRLFGFNKEPEVRDPVIFHDREHADQIFPVAEGAEASSELTSQFFPFKWPAENAVDDDGDTWWLSRGHDIRNYTEYIQIRLPQGRYNDFYLNAADDQEVYVSLYTKELDDGSPPTRNGVALTHNSWVDGSSGAEVPGVNGGHTYIRHWDSLSGKAVRNLTADDASFVVGDDSILRISLRNLYPGNLSDPGGEIYVASVTGIHARRRRRLAETMKQKWVLVDDISDVVKQILRWAGFKEFGLIEQTGVTLDKRFVANRGHTYMDVIQKMAEAVGFTFYVGDPSTDPDSIGVPVFRQTRAVLPIDPVATIKDTDLLNAVQVHHTDEPLAFNIRVRGREAKKSEDGKIIGHDPRRLHYTFRPPWSNPIGEFEQDRMGGVLKHLIYINDLFKTLDDCKFGAYMIALREALASVTVTFEFPAWPGFDLDEHLELQDLTTGITSRVIVTNRSSSFERTGETVHWTMTVGGGVIDIPDVLGVIAIIRAARRS